MGAELPKQFLMVGGKPVLVRTVEAFRSFDPAMEIVLVLPAEQQEYWKKLCESYDCCVACRLADGGDTRFQSVRNGLALVEEGGLVAVHDGVRPFVSPQVIERCFREALLKDAVIPVTGVVETLRELEGDSSRTVPRDAYKLVQTPQVFASELLKRAYRQPYDPSFTDDASVVESLGVPVYLVEGNRENIKITTPFDLKIAEVLTGCSI